MSTPKNTPLQSRFWDQFNTEDLQTTQGFKARFGPTVGGGSNTWPNRRVRVSAQIADKTGKSFIQDIGAFYISKIRTSRNDPTAELQLHALTKPLQKSNAEKVKNGTQWWENVPLSFLINRLLETVYREEDGQLSEKLTVNRQDLAGPTQEGDHQLWNLGVPPNWDGQSFQPSPNANPITAMVDLPGTEDIVVGLGGYNGYKAELWRYNSTEDLWFHIASNQHFDGPIQSLVYNESEDLVYGVCWDDPAIDERSAQVSGHKWLAPDAKLFWKGPLDQGGFLDEGSNSVDINDFFPGVWDVREMFPLEYGAGDLPENSDTPGQLGPFLKDDFKASAGNFEAVEQITLPIPGGDPLDRSSFPLIDDQDYAYEQDPLGKELFIKKDFIGIEAEVKTINGQTQWIPDPNAAYNGQVFSGEFSNWSSDGNSVSFTSTSSFFSTGVILNSKYAHRIRIKGFSGTGVSLEVLADTLGDPVAIVKELPIDATLQEVFVEIPQIGGLTSSLNDSTIQTLLVLRFNHSSSTNITIGSISVVPVINARIAERVEFQAGENIPITHFSKVAVGVYNQKPTNNGVEGPKYDLYNNMGERFEPLTGDLRAISFVPGEPSIAFATDKNGSIYRTGDQGLTWRRAGALRQLRALNDIYMHTTNLGWVVGDNGNIAKSENASSTTTQGPLWMGVETGMERNIRRIDFYDSDIGWFVGDSGSIYKTVNGGLSWQETITDISPAFTDFHIFDASTVIAIRYRDSVRYRVHKTTNQGSSWSTYDISSVPPYNASTNAFIAFVDNSLGFIVARTNHITTGVSAFVIYRTTDGGQTWTVDDGPIVQGAEATYARGHSITDLMVDGGTLVYTTNKGLILRYNYSTQIVSTLYTQPDIKGVYSIKKPATDTYIAVGDGGMVLRSTNNGQTWTDTSLSWKAEEVTLDFNLVAQNRRNLASGEFDAFNPLFGPAVDERGISVDNSVRKLIANTFGESATNDIVIEDIAPAFDYVSRRSHPWVGWSSYNADPNDFRSGQAGNGYLSVAARTIGNKGGRWRNSSELPLHGIVRFTNGQQGLFQLAEGANQGKGMILFTQRITDNDPPVATQQFRWGPGASGHRFKTKLVAFDCDTKQLIDIMDLETTDSPNPGSPYNEQIQFPYPIAGASNGSKVYVSLVTNPVYTRLFTGDNQVEVASINRIHEIDLKEGIFNVNNVTADILYDSRADQSVYNVVEEEDSVSIPGQITNEYAEITEGPAGPINRTRKITHLHYSSRFEKLFGSGFRKDSLLSSVDSGELTPPCHEVFYLNPDEFNQLVIVDHDVQEGRLADAIQFTGFSEQSDRIWYFRLSSPTIDPHAYQRLGKGAQLCYISQGDRAIEGGHYWDDLNFGRTKTLREARRFISHGAAATSLISMGDPVLEREALFSSFDHYFRRDHLTEQTLNDILGRPKVFFKIDTYGLDKRIELADFSGMKAWDVIVALANANGLVFGFNQEFFFMVPRNRVLKTHTLSASQGDIEDIEKEVSDDIRNIVTVSAYSPQQHDGEWEVTHVGRDAQNRINDIEDERLFEGELDVNVTSPEQGSVLMICTRRGRLLTIGFEPDAIEVGDANDHIWDRNPVLFKWLTHSPSISIVLMQEMGEDDRELLVNTLYQSSDNPIRPGDIVIFTDQEEMEPVGKVIESVDSSINLIRLEEAPGFAVEKFITLSVIRSHLGTDVDSNGTSTVKRWGDKFSDEGVAVIKDVYRGNLSADPTNKVLNASIGSIGGAVFQVKYMEFRFESPHNMQKGDSFEIAKTGDPNFRFAGSFVVNSFTEKTVRVVYSGGPLSTFSDPNGTDEVFLVNNEFKSALQGTVLRLNSINAFRGVRIHPYGPGYRHFNFLVTTLPTNTIGRVGLPNLSNVGHETQINAPIAYIHSINFSTMEISLGPGDYSSAFQKGDVLNAHYIFSPTTNKEADLPYQGLSQQIPGGFGSWRWTAEPASDLFNVGDVIRLKFEGLRLEQDSASSYTLVDSASIRRWGENEYTQPDNRFIEHGSALKIAREIIRDFAEPGLLLRVIAPYSPEIGFLTKGNQDLQLIEIEDPLMFGSIPGFKVSGTIKYQEVDLNRKKMDIEILTDQRY